MAEGFARRGGWKAFSAGIKPEVRVNPFALEVMAEMKIDISHHRPSSVDEYLSKDFFLLATVCDNAKENCPVFHGSYDHILHHSFRDPANASGSDEEILQVYRQIRDEIQIWIEKLNKNYLA